MEGLTKAEKSRDAAGPRRSSNEQRNMPTSKQPPENQPPAAQPRRDWKEDPGVVDPQERQARAMEYMAYYLDRIEAQLDRIATAAGKGQASLTTIGHMMAKLEKR
jgi:hypothetical protein